MTEKTSCLSQTTAKSKKKNTVVYTTHTAEKQLFHMCGRFGVDLDSLYRDNDLIITDMYGNIAPKKGVI